LADRSKLSEILVVDEDKDVDDGDEGSDDGADKHLTHLTQVKNNCNHDISDINFTCIVKNTPTSLKNGVTGHVTHFRFLEKCQCLKM
jgi:hypothetical protein